MHYNYKFDEKMLNVDKRNIPLTDPNKKLKKKKKKKIKIYHIL